MIVTPSKVDYLFLQQTGYVVLEDKDFIDIDKD
jgi:hypothetical protein